MAKNLLLVSEHHQIDRPLRRSLEHLAKSCDITIVHNGEDFFEQMSAAAFDLVIIDFGISEFDGLELAESVQYIDPGMPVILMLEEKHRAVWEAARQLKAQPIIRPFKPLKFLRLVDKLLHKHLNYYRKLTEALKTTLESLRTGAVAPCAFLVEEGGEILIASGDVADIPPAELGLLAADSFALEHAKGQWVQYQLDQNYGLYVTFVADSLYLGLVSPIGEDLQASERTWQQVEVAASQVRTVLFEQVAESSVPQNGSSDRPPRKFIPLKAGFNQNLPAIAGGEEDNQAEEPVNWGIVSNTSNILKRMENFCQLD